MRYINYLLISLASALIAVYATLWLNQPSPLETTTIPPIVLQQTESGLVLWGGWRTVEGYVAPGTNAVEIRCNRERKSCSEAYASILHHSQGEDLEAAVFNYRITAWTDRYLEAVVVSSMAECLDRLLVIHIPEKSATLQWKPQIGCDADKGRAVLIGDPI